MIEGGTEIGHGSGAEKRSGRDGSTLTDPLTPAERGASRYARGKAKAASIPASAIPAQGGYRWDERRNTSRVFGVPPDAVPKASQALAELRRRDPALVAWIEDGAPNLTQWPSDSAKERPSAA